MRKKFLPRFASAVLSVMVPCLLAFTGLMANAYGDEAESQTAEAAAQDQEISGIHWSDSPQEVNKEAAQTGKPIVVDFYTDWCGYCKKQDATSYQDDRVVLLFGEVVPAKINAEQQTELAAMYKVTGYPTVVVMDKDGKVIDRVDGAYEPDGYVEWVSGAIWKHSGQRMLQQWQKNPKDLVLATRLALLQQETDQGDPSTAMFNKAAALAADEATPQKASDKSDLLRAYRVLAGYFLPLQDYEKVIPVLNRIVAISPYPLEVLATRYNLAESYYQNNQTPKAISEMETILKTEGLTAQQKRAVQEKLETYKKVAN